MTTSSRRESAASTEPPRGHGDGLIAGGLTPRPRSARHGNRRTRRRRRATALMAAMVLVAGIGALAFNLPRRAAASGRPAGQSQINQQILAGNKARTEAIDWILQQVNRAAVVGCDPEVCTDLVNSGFPVASVLQINSESTDPLGSTLVVATAPIKAQFGKRLANVYAPLVIASFGSGSAEIDIRWMYSGGSAAYGLAEKGALSFRKVGGAQLLANSQVKATATARAKLLSGDVDPRLLMLIAMLAAVHPVHILDFVDQSPGGGAASLLRSMDLATVDGAAHLSSAAYVSWIQAFANAQRAQYHPAWVQPVTLHPGQAVLRIGFSAPSPLE